MYFDLDPDLMLVAAGGRNVLVGNPLLLKISSLTHGLKMGLKFKSLPRASDYQPGTDFENGSKSPNYDSSENLKSTHLLGTHFAKLDLIN